MEPTDRALPADATAVESAEPCPVDPGVSDADLSDSLSSDAAHELAVEVELDDGAPVVGEDVVTDLKAASS